MLARHYLLQDLRALLILKKGSLKLTDFRILQIEIDNQAIYIRRETVGASTIGGDNPIPYQQSVVQAHFRNMLKHNNTRVDQAIASAHTIKVTVLCRLTGNQGQADAVKAYEIKQARQNGLQVLNT